jgi:hypothetical protein
MMHCVCELELGSNFPLVWCIVQQPQNLLDTQKSKLSGLAKQPAFVAAQDAD